MSKSRQHRALVERLLSKSSRSWSETALLACLKRLASGGPTDGHLITVHDAWPVADGDGDGICVIYHDPADSRIGVRVLRTSSVDHPLRCTSTHPAAET